MRKHCVFERSILYSSSVDLAYLIKNTGKNYKIEILLQHNVFLFYYIFKYRPISVMLHYSSLQCHVIQINHSNMVIYYHC